MMSGPSVPELPPLATLTRCASQPSVLGPAPLPRFVAPPASQPGASAADIACSVRVPQASPDRRLGTSSVRGFSATPLDRISGSWGNSIGMAHELPALRESPVKNGLGSSRPSSLSRSLASPDFQEHFEGHSKGGVASLQEIESLKKQVAKLTQLRRDRDSYIADLLAEQRAADRRHEGELAQRTARSQRQVTERLAAAQQEHHVHFDERSRVHASALAQQALQHELELAELQKALRAESDRRLTLKLTEAAREHRNVLDSLTGDIVTLEQSLAGHAASLETASQGVAKDGLEKGASAAGLDASMNSDSWEPGRSHNEPEPEECHASFESDDGNDSQKAVADEAVREAIDRTELALAAARKTLDRAVAAGVGVVSTGSMLGKIGLNSEADQLFSHRNSANFDVSKANASRTAQNKALQNLRSDFQRRLKNSGCTLAQVNGQLHLMRAFLTWKVLAGHSRRLVTEEAERRNWASEAGRQARLLRLARRQQGLRCLQASSERCRHVALRAWASVAAKAKMDAKSENLLQEAEARSQAALIELRGMTDQEVKALREKLKENSITRVKSELCRVQQQVLKAWCRQAALAQLEQAKKQEQAAQQQYFRACLQKRHDAALELGGFYTQQVAFFAWAWFTRSSRKDAVCEHRLKTQALEAKAETDAVQAESKRDLQKLSQKTKMLAKHVVQRIMQRSMAAGLYWWAVAVRDARREARHRHHILTAESDASSELYRVKNEAKRTAVDLRLLCTSTTCAAKTAHS